MQGSKQNLSVVLNILHSSSCLAQIHYLDWAARMLKSRLKCKDNGHSDVHLSCNAGSTCAWVAFSREQMFAKVVVHLWSLKPRAISTTIGVTFKSEMDNVWSKKSRVWESGTKHQTAQFSSRGISKGAFPRVTQPGPAALPARGWSD